MKIIISGGGTGGHIYPAIAIAHTLKAKHPNTEILFVGALGRMEMEKVPQEGYEIVGLPIAGIQRKINVENIIKNLKFPFLLIQSLASAFKIVKKFKPDVVVGVGGYASGPVLFAAQMLGIPTLIQEQNSYAGVTNKLLSKRANKICVAYENLEQYFPKEKIIYTGNPVRKDIMDADMMKLPGVLNYRFSAEKKTILVIGGSLGAKTINKSIEKGIEKLKKSGIQLIWQTGKNYTSLQLGGWAWTGAFIKEMHWAYGAADVIISRAGALSISELCLVGKPVILVPSPNVSEDHQTKNALALVNRQAAILVKDAEAEEKLVDTILGLLQNETLCKEIRANIKQMGKPNAAESIVDEILKLVRK
jgi:UDP-N-acetylglucosamine--N-acetylmuramyl-(pentapeptide) pyrophosphoryl-undecaprenol N-acetylglucosamine transferase